MKTVPVESFEEAAQRFPGLDQLDPQAVSRFVFFSAGNFPEELYESEAQPDMDYWGQTPREEWISEVSLLLSRIRRWRKDRQHDVTTTRFELSKGVEQEFTLHKETTQLVESLGGVDADTGFDSVIRYLNKWDYRVALDLAPSPMFPGGRRVKKPIAEFIDTDARQCILPYGAGIVREGVRDDSTNLLDEDIKDYLTKGHEIVCARAKRDEAFSQLEEIDEDELQKLRELYGAKAAHLLAFENVLNKFYEKSGKGSLQKIEIPPFVAVAVDMYEAWSQGTGNYSAMLARAHEAAAELASKAEGGLIAIRSSAVYSEDGQEHTGAGIYKSVVVDPNDFNAFAGAIEEVYQSTNTTDSLAYREGIGISQEKMGLIIQSYVEKVEDSSRDTYGFINSRAMNSNIIEAHTTAGVLLFDKPKLQMDLLLDRWHVDEDSYLHSRPDHSTDLRRMPHQVIEAVHAAVFAELVFKTPIQLEYVAEGQVVQVRPLPEKSFETNANSIDFPDDIEEITKTKAIGTGDVTLEKLDEWGDNRDKEGFVVFRSEYAFTDSFSRSHAGTRALPRKGAVVILNHSESGHVQTLCREMGLMCFYPDNKSDELEGLKDALYEDDQRRQDASTETETEKVQRLRFVSDGYDGRIYRA